MLGPPGASIADDIQRALDQLWQAGLVCWPDEVAAGGHSLDGAPRRPAM